MVNAGRYTTAARGVGGRDDLKLLLVGLLVIGLGLVVLHVLAELSGIGKLEKAFDLSRERSLPSWFSSMQLFLVAAVAFRICWLRRELPDQLRWPMALFGLAFTYLSIDEYIGLHEALTKAIQGVDWVPTFNTHGAWIVPYLIVGLLAVFAVRRALAWVWQHDRHAFFAALLGAVIYVAGAVGVELPSYYVEARSVAWEVLLVFEEWLEMAGVSFILYATLHLGRVIGSLASDRSQSV